MLYFYLSAEKPVVHVETRKDFQLSSLVPIRKEHDSQNNLFAQGVKHEKKHYPVDHSFCTCDNILRTHK